MQASSAGVRALIVTSDPEIVAMFNGVFVDIGVTTNSCVDQISAGESLSHAKFEALVLDFDLNAQEALVIKSMRANPANRNAVLIGVATKDSAKQRAQSAGAAFVLERPLIRDQVARMLRVAHGLMLRDRRQYFRLSISLKASILTGSGKVLECRTINVSRNGMAVHMPTPLQAGEVVDVTFPLPTPGPLILAQGTIVWDDKHGKAGLTLSFPNPGVHSRVSEWLDSEFHAQFEITKHQ